MHPLTEVMSGIEGEGEGQLGVSVVGGLGVERRVTQADGGSILVTRPAASAGGTTRRRAYSSVG